MVVHPPIAIYIAFCIYQKKIFVREVVRGIDFEKSLLERLSPEGGQNWHKLTSHMCSNMHQTNKNTTLTQLGGRIVPEYKTLSFSPQKIEGRFFVAA